MKSFVAILALVAVAAADVSHLPGVRNSGSDRDAVITRYDADVQPESSQYAFETSNGIAAQANGVLKNAGREDEAFVVTGSNSYVAPDGQQISIQYVADENGYQPQGSNLPTPPPTQPIPEYIQRSLAWIAAHPQQPETYANRRI